jgi:hypothetical protein
MVTQAWQWERDPHAEAHIERVYRDGHLYLGTDRCGMDWLLIVAGPDRGHVWRRDEYGAQPCEP